VQEGTRSPECRINTISSKGAVVTALLWGFYHSLTKEETRVLQNNLSLFFFTPIQYQI